MYKFSRNLFFAFLVGVISFSASGCLPLVVGAAAGAGSVIWAKGTIQQDFNRPLNSVYKATKVALKKLDVPIIVDKKDNLTAHLESQFADGKKIKIDIEYVSTYTSKISIRVGTLGDENKSREILEMVIKYL